MHARIPGSSRRSRTVHCSPGCRDYHVSHLPIASTLARQPPGEYLDASADARGAGPSRRSRGSCGAQGRRYPSPLVSRNSSCSTHCVCKFPSGIVGSYRLREITAQLEDEDLTSLKTTAASSKACLHIKFLDVFFFLQTERHVFVPVSILHKGCCSWDFQPTHTGILTLNRSDMSSQRPRRCGIFIRKRRKQSSRSSYASDANNPAERHQATLTSEDDVAVFGIDVLTRNSKARIRPLCRTKTLCATDHLLRLSSRLGRAGFKTQRVRGRQRDS